MTNETRSPSGARRLSSRWSPALAPTKILPWVGSILAMAAVYVGSAKLGLSMAFFAEQVSAVWPPTGIALAAILLFGFRIWPGITFGAFIANATANEPLLVAGGIAVGNTLEAVVGAWLLRRVIRFDNSLERLRDAVGLIVLAAGFSTMISATIGVASLCLGGVYLPALERPIQWSDFGSLWWVWWLGDAMGALVVAPVLLTWAGGRSRAILSRWPEAVALTLAFLAASWLIFDRQLFAGLGEQSLSYFVFSFVIWAAVRLGQPGTTAVTFIASGIAIAATLGGVGPFGAGPIHDRLLLLQLFMGVVAITALLLGAALAERRQAEADVRQSEEKLRVAVEELETLMDILPVGIFIAEDVACSKITMNSAGAAMLQIPSNANASKTGPDAAGLAFRILKDGVEVPNADLPMQRAARTGVPVVGEEFQVVRDNGTSVTLYEYASPLYDAYGKVRACLGVFVDITARKRAEEKLQEADRRKDEFLATLAHELRNPLAPMRTGVDVLRLVGKQDAQVREVLEMLDRQVHQITRLVDDLLDVSRVTLGKIQLHLQPVDLSEVISLATENSRQLLDAQGHEFSVSLPDEPLWIRADSTRLAQVFTNLLNNAGKYTEGGGRIMLAAAREGDEAVVRLRDTGRGISRSLLPHIFDLFVQGDRSHIRSEGGLGIGLTLVRRLVEMQGGSVQALSEGPGKGSEFVVRLALVPRPLPGAIDTTPDESNSSASGRTGRILVVDDNVDAARCLEMLLIAAGHVVLTAPSGAVALEAVATHPPDVVLLDIGLPGMDGYEVARRIRSMPAGEQLAIVAVTGWGQPEDQSRSLDAGFDHHLTKPVDHTALRDLLATLLAKAPVTEQVG